jgi:cytoskeleton protein RodZ
VPAVPSANNGAQVFGALNRNARVILRARGDTRVTVRGPEGQFLLNRDLKAGDSYQVPEMPGITMATNDAGAVEVDVDGVALGRAGQPQQILGRVSLDPQSLADRFNNR